MQNESFRILSTKDMESGYQRIVLVDELASFVDYLRLRSHIYAAGTLIVVINIPPAGIKSFWFRRLAGADNIRRFTWHIFSFCQRYTAEDQAIENVEKVYSWLLENERIPLKPLESLYGDPDVCMAFKKQLVLWLADYFRVVNAAQSLQSLGRPIQLSISSQWQQMDQYMRLAGVKTTLPEKVNDSFGVSFSGQLEKIGKKFLFLAGLLGTVPWILSRIRKINFHKSAPKSMQLAIRLYNNDWGLRGQATHEADWLLDGERFHPGNTLFVAENQLNKDYENEISHRKYTLSRQYYKAAFREVSVDFILRILILQNFKRLGALFLQSLSTPINLMKVVVHAWMDYFMWQNFICHYFPMAYFACHDIQYRHIFRNILLGTIGCQSWYFDHSNSKIQMYENNGKLSGREALRDYMKFDGEIHWGRQLIQLAQKHHNRSRFFEAYGPIWYREIKKTALMDKIILDRWGSNPAGIILAVFTTTNSLQAINGEKTHRDFLQAFVNMLNDPHYPDLRILLKHKNLNYEEYMGLEGTDIAEVYENLKKHPRAIVLNPRFSSNAIVSYAHLVVSMAFASPTVEALVAGKRAFYYDASNAYRNSFFEKFPRIVAHNGLELKDTMNYWLSLPERDFMAYLEKYIFPEYGGNLDVSPMQRIRQSLNVSK